MSGSEMRRLSIAGRFARDERGSILPLVGLCLMVVLGFAAVAIDLGQQAALRSEMQATADAAALAAASQLPDLVKARAKAEDYAEKNMPAATNGTVLADDDIVFGTWYANTRQFIANGPITNAVQVTVRRSTANGNPAPTFFLHVFGQHHADLAAKAMAGAVLFNHAPQSENGEMSAEDQARVAEMQAAVAREWQERLGHAPGGEAPPMSDQEIAEFLLEEFGKAVLLK
jgi:Flp pilus assembly protein TadG